MSIQSRLKEVQIALSESMESKVPMQFEINKLNRERDSLHGNLKLLEDEVKSKTQQLITLNTHITTTTTNFEMVFLFYYSIFYYYYYIYVIEIE